MPHTILFNSENKPMRHPDTGQVILPGQRYAVPEDGDLVELVDATLPYISAQRVADPEAAKKASAKSQKKATDGQ